MPSENFHRLKRDGFRNSGQHLNLHGPADSADAAVQDFFYAALHEVERFLSLFGTHSGGHRNLIKIIIDNRIIQRRGRVFIGDPAENRGVPVARTVERSVEFYYLQLYAMRYLKIYGSLPRNVQIPPGVGGRLFAYALDVNIARGLFLIIANNLARHENNLRRRRLI